MESHSLHDGACFTLAMLSTDRAWPNEEYPERVLKRQAPFNTHLLRNSDRLFPLINKSR